MRRRWVFAAACLLIVALMQGICAMQYAAIKRSVPYSAELRMEGGVTMAQVTDTLEFIRSGTFAAQSVELQAVISFDGNEMSAVVVYVTPKLGTILPLRLDSGEWVSEDKQVVLSKNVASTLFPGTAPEGNSITVDGNIYFVTGTYTDGNLPAVFIADYSSDVPIASLFLADMKFEEYKDAKLFSQRAAEILQLPLSGELRDYRELVGLAQSMWYLSVVLCAFAALILVLVIASKLILGAVFAREEPAHRRVLRAGLAVVLASVGLIGFAVMLRGLCIPGVFLPPDNIFDFAFYWVEILEFFSRASEYVYEARFATRITPLAVTGAVSVLVFCVGVVLAYRSIIRLTRSDVAETLSNASD